MNINRRKFSTSILCFGVAALSPKLAFSKEIASLSKLGAEKGIDIGVAFDLNSHPAVKNIILEHCNLIVPEYTLQPKYVASSKTRRKFAEADRIYKYAIMNGKKFHGHSLFWHQQRIEWAESKSFDEVKKLYGGYIREVLVRYPKAVSWDVFNEIIEEKTKFRKQYLISKFGLDFVEFCLKEARAAAPNAKLVINDYNLECAGNWCGKKQKNLISVIKELKRRGAPIDVVGIQGHLSSKYKPSPKKTLRFIRKIEKLGLDVYISELDVNDINFPKSVSKRDTLVAGYYGSFLKSVLKSKAVKRVTFWGITDDSNWIYKGWAGEKIKGVKARPALFDLNHKPKKAFFAVQKELRKAKRR